MKTHTPEGYSKEELSRFDDEEHLYQLRRETEQLKRKLFEFIYFVRNRSDGGKDDGFLAGQCNYFDGKIEKVNTAIQVFDRAFNRITRREA